MKWSLIGEQQYCVVFMVCLCYSSILVFSYPSLRLLCTVHVHRKLINAIGWHPEYTSQSSAKSDYRCWLATASVGFNVHVIDLADVIGQLRHTTSLRHRKNGN